MEIFFFDLFICKVIVKKRVYLDEENCGVIVVVYGVVMVSSMVEYINFLFLIMVMCVVDMLIN